MEQAGARVADDGGPGGVRGRHAVTALTNLADAVNSAPAVRHRLRDRRRRERGDRDRAVGRESSSSCGSCTGAALAWVYPPGMKIAAGWFRERRGTALGIVVGAVGVGSAFPHLLAWLGAGLPWRVLVGASSILALAGARSSSARRPAMART